MVKVKGWKAFYSSTNFFLAATLEADQSSYRSSKAGILTQAPKRYDS